jgi:hypothetical protein
MIFAGNQLSAALCFDPHRHYALIRAGQGVCRLLDRILLDVDDDHVGARLSDAEPMP